MEDENTAMLKNVKGRRSSSRSSEIEEAKKTTTHSSGVDLNKKIKILQRPRTTILIIIGLAVLTLIFNIAWLSWASTISKPGYGDSIIFRGSCNQVKNLKLWLHLLINILSTALVSGSNYCVQALNAPTREEIDDAHANGQSCRIGIYDLSNLFKIPWAKRWTIFALSFSSWTLHLVYNATILSSLSTTSYHVLGVTTSFFTNGAFDLEGLSLVPPNATTEAQYWQANLNQLQPLNNTDCIEAYISPLVTDRGDLLLVLDNQAVSESTSSNSSIVSWDTPCFDCGDTLDWLCEGLVPDFTRYEGGSNGLACTEVLIRRNIQNAANWTVSGGHLGSKSVPIMSCLSQQTPERCALEYSRDMTIVVIVWNAVKIACMVVAALSCRHTLMTVGDAIYSFLKLPVNVGTPVNASDTDFAQTKRKDWLSKLGLKRETLLVTDQNQFFSDQPRSWWRPVSRGRALLLIIISVIVIVLTSVYLAVVIHHLQRLQYPTSFGHLWTLGFGDVSGFSLLTGTHTGIVGNSVIANIPQLMVSAFYFIINGIVTSQLAEREWNRFGYQWRRIRVTFPTDESASLYLSMPYAYTGPILILFILLHLCVSQALFAVEITFYTWDGKSGKFSSHYNATTAGTEGMTFSTLGSSALPTIVAFFMFGAMVVTVVGNSFRKYRTEMPFPGTQSIVIAAATHASQGADEWLSKVIRWKRSDNQKDGELRWGYFVSKDSELEVGKEGAHVEDTNTNNMED